MSDTACSRLTQVILNDKNDYAAWLTLGGLLLKQRNLDDLDQLLTYRHGLGMSGAQLAFDVCLRDLMHHPNTGDVSFLADNTGEHNAFSGAFLVGAGYAELRRYQLDSGVALVREGHRRLGVLRQLFDFETVEQLGQIAVSAFLFETWDWSRRSAPQDFDGTMSMVFDAAKGGHPLTCCAFADSAYFLHYAEPFVDLLRKNGVADCNVMLGIVNPTPEALSLAGDLGRSHRVGIVAVPYRGDCLPEFAASARFLFANQILAAAAEPVVFLDIDATFPDGADRVLRAAASHPIACVETNNLPPGLLVDASVVGAQPGAAASRFFDLAARYILTKLKETGPLWTFDQVALHRAIAQARMNADRVMNLNDVLGDAFRLPGFFKKHHSSSLPLSNRFSLRTNARVYYNGLDDELRPMWRDKDAIV